MNTKNLLRIFFTVIFFSIYTFSFSDDGPEKWKVVNVTPSGDLLNGSGEKVGTVDIFFNGDGDLIVKLNPVSNGELLIENGENWVKIYDKDKNGTPTGDQVPITVTNYANGSVEYKVESYNFGLLENGFVVHINVQIDGTQSSDTGAAIFDVPLKSIPAIPIDGGLGFLLLGGAALGGRKLFGRKK